MTTLRSATNTSRNLTQTNVAVDITDTEKGKEMLARSEADDSPWRAALAGSIRSVRVVEIQTSSSFGGADPFGPPMTDSFIEVVTDHGTMCVVPFTAGERALAFVSDSRNKGLLTGTWRKRSGIVGHACFWTESFHWSAGRRGSVRRNSRNLHTRYGNEWDVLSMARTGSHMSDDEGPRSIARCDTAKLMEPCEERRRIAHAKRVLAADGKRVA